MNQFSFQYPAWYLLLCMAIAIGGTMLLYYQSRFFSTHPLYRKVLLAFLRFAALFLLSALLLNPLIKSFKKDIKKPMLILAEDVSQSMVEENTDWIDPYSKQREDALKSLSVKYNCISIGFSQAVNELNDKISFGKETFSGKKTDISAALDWVRDHADLQHLKGIILLTDGIYNSGKNPLYHSLISTFPVYPLMTGDTTQETDLAIQRVYHNDIIYAGDKFSVECDVQAWNLEKETTEIKLEKWENGKWSNLEKFTFDIKSNVDFRNRAFIIDANKAGIARYRMSSKKTGNERNIRNNEKEFFVDILDAKKKVLILCHSPHPDISAIKDALSNNKNYEIVINYAEDPVVLSDEMACAILHQLPGNQTNANNWIQAIKARNIPCLYIVGSKSNLSALNSLQSIIQIQSGNSSSNEALPLYQSNFSSFTCSEELIKRFSIYPPLSAPFGTYKLDPQASILCKQRIGKIDTDYPLIVVARQQEEKTAFILGEGIWKWRFQDFVQSQNFNSFYELISKLIQFTGTKDDKRKFKVSLAKRIFDENESVIFNGELYNDAYERINSPEINMKLKEKGGVEYDYQFSKKDNYYELNASTLPAGEYEYVATAVWGGKELKERGSFSIRLLDFETAHIKADWNLLKALADKSGGTAFKTNGMQELVKLLLEDQAAKPIIYQNQEVKPMLEKLWIFIMAFLLLATEWFLRRWWGSY